MLMHGGGVRSCGVCAAFTCTLTLNLLLLHCGTVDWAAGAGRRETQEERRAVGDEECVRVPCSCCWYHSETCFVIIPQNTQCHASILFHSGTSNQPVCAILYQFVFMILLTSCASTGLTRWRELRAGAGVSSAPCAENGTIICSAAGACAKVATTAGLSQVRLVALAAFVSACVLFLLRSYSQTAAVERPRPGPVFGVQAKVGGFFEFSAGPHGAMSCVSGSRRPLSFWMPACCLRFGGRCCAW